MKIRMLMMVEVMEIRDISETSWCDGSEGNKYDNDYDGVEVVKARLGGVKIDRSGGEENQK